MEHIRGAVPLKLSAWIVLVGYVLCLLVPKRPVAVIIFLVSWPRGDGVPDRHPRYLVDAKLEIIEWRLPGVFRSIEPTTSYINNDLTSGKGSIADLERLNVYFWKVL